MHVRSIASGSTLIRIFLLMFLLPLFVSIQGRDLYRVRRTRKCCFIGDENTSKQQVIIKEYINLTEIQHKLNTNNQINNQSINNNNNFIVYNSSYPKASDENITFHVLVNSVVLNDTRNGTKDNCSVITDVDCEVHTMGAVIFWGAQTYMSTNLAHIILCLIVVIIYLVVPVLNRGLYNRLVVRHMICLAMNGIVLQMLGFSRLGNYQLNDYFIILSWLILQYFTIATVFWLNIICFDMTLAITRFQWIVGTSKRNLADDNRKLLFYGLFAWGGSFLPVLLAGLCDFIPTVPQDFILKPKYLNYLKGPNPIVNVYYFAVPMFTLLLNNILFVFTTWKIIQIQRSTQIATQNQNHRQCQEKSMMRKKYFLFLRLYLLMGAPWFFGMFLACFNKLVLLKTCRLVQPSLWILMLATHKEVIKKLKSLCLRHRRSQSNIATIST